MRKAKTPTMTSPPWEDDMTLISYAWCIRKGIYIRAFACGPGYANKSWTLEVEVNGKKITSPKEYGPTELYPKMFELYKFYYDKYNDNNR
jgi:hypothetical protein